MNSNYQNLTEPFHPEVERVVTKGGMPLTYIPVSEVINRLNKVLGVENWSFEIVSCARDLADPDYILAHVRITYNVDGSKPIIRDGFGGSKVKRAKQSSQIVDLGDDFKGAVSDALKKAAQTLGVGLYLARSDDAIEIEMASESPVGAVASQTESAWESFYSISKTLTKEQKEELRSSWNDWSGGKPVPTKETVTPESIDFLVAEATRIIFGATSS